MGGLRITVAASGGGHLRQIVDLKDVWQKHEASIVTEDTVFARTILPTVRKRFVKPFALGQARSSGVLRLLLLLTKNIYDSIGAVRDLRPEIVISTGAGSVFFFVLLSRLCGSRVIIVETFSRYRRLSKFAYFSARFSDVKILQTKSLVKYWPTAPVFDPIRILHDEPPPKQSLIFVTVGASLPFDRLVNSMLSLKAAGRIQGCSVL